MTVLERINNYLLNGGLFNPELMEHDKVLDLLLDARNEIENLRRALERACIGSCNCSTKTPDPESHAESCDYKIYRTALCQTTSQ